MIMTYYHQQVKFLHKNLYPKEYLLAQVIRSKKFIDDNFDKNLSIDDLAGEAFLSKFHFTRLFKQYYGKTPYQYLTEVRIIKAKELLAAGHTVTETCYMLGFNSLSSFSALFKKLGGSPPNEYQRKKARLNK